jgi:hypothetical protein
MGQGDPHGQHQGGVRPTPTGWRSIFHNCRTRIVVASSSALGKRCSDRRNSPKVSGRSRRPASPHFENWRCRLERLFGLLDHGVGAAQNLRRNFEAKRNPRANRRCSVSRAVWRRCPRSAAGRRGVRRGRRRRRYARLGGCRPQSRRGGARAGAGAPRLGPGGWRRQCQTGVAQNKDEPFCRCAV